MAPQKLNELEIRLEREMDDSNTTWQDYFQYVMTNNGLSYPSSVAEAGILFERLVQYAKGNLE